MIYSVFSINNRSNRSSNRPKRKARKPIRHPATPPPYKEVNNAIYS